MYPFPGKSVVPDSDSKTSGVIRRFNLRKFEKKIAFEREKETRRAATHKTHSRPLPVSFFLATRKAWESALHASLANPFRLWGRLYDAANSYRYNTYSH